MNKGNDKCSIHCIHEEDVEYVKKKMHSDESLFKLAEFFKVFGDTTRIKILFALMEKELCVCDISAILNISQSAISHQLRILKSNRLVKSKRVGKVVYYTLDDEHVENVFKEGLKHIEHI